MLAIACPNCGKFFDPHTIGALFNVLVHRNSTRVATCERIESLCNGCGRFMDIEFALQIAGPPAPAPCPDPSGHPAMQAAVGRHKFTPPLPHPNESWRDRPPLL